MPFEVYDYRTDLRNVVVTPELRGRFLRFEPNEVHGRHSHDLGHEIFLILEGACEMEIDGARAVLGPGQMCVAYAHQMHQARNAGDTPMVMYLSVTPHIQPTHTLYDQETGERLPPRYTPPSTWHQEDTLAGVPTAELADRQVAAARALAATAREAADVQAEQAEALKRAAEAGDPAAVQTAMDAMWERVHATFRAVSAMAATWNDLTPRAAEPRR